LAEDAKEVFQSPALNGITPAGTAPPFLVPNSVVGAGWLDHASGSTSARQPALDVGQTLWREKMGKAPKKFGGTIWDTRRHYD
jgi:hypothetical protein